MPEAIAPAVPGATLEQARAAYDAARVTKGPAQNLDGEVFLKLLVTQLQNQDPSSPMDTNQMISQAAQLSMTETMNGIADSMKSQNATFSISTANALIGKNVEWVVDGIRGTGLVTGASFQNGTAMLNINDELLIDQTTITGLTPAN